MSKKSKTYSTKKQDFMKMTFNTFKKRVERGLLKVKEKKENLHWLRLLEYADLPKNCISQLKSTGSTYNNEKKLDYLLDKKRLCENAVIDVFIGKPELAYRFWEATHLEREVSGQSITVNIGAIKSNTLNQNAISIKGKAETQNELRDMLNGVGTNDK